MKRTEISELGKNTFIKRLTEPFEVTSDDAAVINRGDYMELISTVTMMEGVDFDLQYTPLQHLGYKLITAAVSNIYAMNGTPEFVTVAIGISAKFSVEEVEAIYSGIKLATQKHDVKLIGGNTSASMTGLLLAVTTIGRVMPGAITRRSGAHDTDLLCISGNLGGAYMGLQLLEREKRAVGNSGIDPQLDGHKYILQRQLKPSARRDIISELSDNKIVPTSMIDITRGLASAALHLCQASDCGLRIYLDRLPIASETFNMAEELGIDPVVAALNGGDDFELLFTVPLSRHKEVLTMSGVDVIGHILPATKGAALTTPDGSEIVLQSPDFASQQ